MLLSTLPRAELPQTCHDHFLFYEKLVQSYHCAEQPSALGLLMASNGDCDYFVNGVRHRVQTNQLFLVNHQSRLAVHTAQKQAAPALLFFHSRLPELVRCSIEQSHDKLLDGTGKDRYYDFAYLERIHNNPALNQTIIELVDLGSSCSSFASLKADIMIRNLFEQLLRDNKATARLSENITAIKLSTRLEIVKRISLTREWMEANFDDNITLEDMAAVANMNSQHFLRMFRQVYRTTPHQYLMGVRLEKAKQLLRDGLISVSEVCDAIGFESVSSFSLLFKKSFGLAPAQFSRQS